jgi:cation/acetate symporter
VRSARYSAFWALVFIGLLYTTAPALAMFARYNLISTLHNKPISEVRQIDWVAKWEQTGLLKIADKNGDGIVQVAKGKAVPREGRQARLQRARYDEPERGVSGQRHHRAVDA